MEGWADEFGIEEEIACADITRCFAPSPKSGVFGVCPDKKKIKILFFTNLSSFYLYYIKKKIKQ